MTNNIDSINEAAQATIEYLYTIKGDCSDEAYQAIDILRQLINEEFKPAKTISSQFIYDIMKEVLL